MTKSVWKKVRGFTLVELLAAGAVFMVLVLLLLQVLGGVTNTSDSSQRRLETLKHAVGALERLGFDLQEVVHSGGAAIFVSKGGTTNINDELYFLAPASASASPADARKLSLVKYGVAPRLNGQPDFADWPKFPVLSRTVRPFAWSEDIGSLLPLTATAVAQAAAGGETQQVSPCVIRFEVGFQLWSGGISSQPPTDWRDVRALVVGLVSLDRKAASRLTQEERDGLAARFVKPAPSERPTAGWNGVINSLPQPVRQTIRIYEQTIPI